MSREQRAWDFIGKETEGSDSESSDILAKQSNPHILEEEVSSPGVPSACLVDVVESSIDVPPHQVETLLPTSSTRTAPRMGFPCRTVGEYEWLEVIDQGTFGVVHKARCKATGDLVALKKTKSVEGQGDGFSVTCLREIMALELLYHSEFVVRLREVVTDSAQWDAALERQIPRLQQRVCEGYRTWHAREIVATSTHDVAGLVISGPPTKKRKSRWGSVLDPPSTRSTPPPTPASIAPTTHVSSESGPLFAREDPAAQHLQEGAETTVALRDPCVPPSLLALARSSTPCGPSARIHALAHTLLLARTRAARVPNLMLPSAPTLARGSASCDRDGTCAGDGNDGNAASDTAMYGDLPALGGFSSGPRACVLLERGPAQLPPARSSAETTDACGLPLPYALPLTARARPSGSVFLVLEYMPADLKRVMRRMTTPFPAADAKCIMLQLLRGLADVHAQGLLHRDLKPSNLLVDARGRVKLADFGSARRVDTEDPRFTTPVVTLWYRAPELLLGAQTHTPALDMWAVGCIFAELLLGHPLFRDTGEFPLLQSITRLLGAPDPRQHPSLAALLAGKLAPRAAPGLSGTAALRAMFPRAAFRDTGVLSDSGLALLAALLELEPTRRLSAAEALRHPYFQELPLPVSPAALHWVGRVEELAAAPAKDDFGELQLSALSALAAASDTDVLTPSPAAPREGSAGQTADERSRTADLLES